MSHRELTVIGVLVTSAVLLGCATAPALAVVGKGKGSIVQHSPSTAPCTYTSAIPNVPDLTTNDVKMVQTPSGNVNEVCHFTLPAGAQLPADAITVTGFACTIHASSGDVIATKSTLTVQPDGSATMVCQYHHAAPPGRPGD